MFEAVAVIYSAWLAIFGFLPVSIFVIFTSCVAIFLFIFILKMLKLVWDALPFL